MKFNNIAKAVLAGAMALSMTFTAFAAEEPQPEPEHIEITLDEAVELALAHSSSISNLEDTLDTLEKSRDSLYSAHDTWAMYQGEGVVADEYLNFLNAFVELDTNISNISKYEKLTEEGLRYGLMTIAVYINEMEAGIAIQEENLAIAREQNLMDQTRYRLGLISKNELLELNTQYESAKYTLEELKLNNEALYLSLYKTMGTGYNKKYKIKLDSELVPLDVTEKGLETAISREISQDVYLKILQNSVDAAEFSKNVFSSQGASYDTRKKNLNSANRSYKDGKAAVEAAARESYNNIQKYEQKNEILQKEMEVAQNTYNTMEVNRQVGYVTDLQLRQAHLAVDVAQNNIDTNIYSHMLEKFIFEHPYVKAVSSSGGQTGQQAG